MSWSRCTTWPASSSHIACMTPRSTTLCVLWKLLIAVPPAVTKRICQQLFWIGYLPWIQKWTMPRKNSFLDKLVQTACLYPIFRAYKNHVLNSILTSQTDITCNLRHRHHKRTFAVADLLRSSPVMYDTALWVNFSDGAIDRFASCYTRIWNIFGTLNIVRLHICCYAALLPRRGLQIALHSVCPSVRLSVCLSVCPSVPCADVLCLQLHRLTSEHPK